MNHYTFSEIQIGAKESFVFDIDSEKMDLFSKISGDKNPLHTDLQFAKSKGFSENVVYGMLTASSLSTLAGMYLPGERSIIHSVEIKFVSPVLLSACPLSVSGEVIEKDERFNFIQLKFTIKNKLDIKVAQGKMQIGVTA